MWYECDELSYNTPDFRGRGKGVMNYTRTSSSDENVTRPETVGVILTCTGIIHYTLSPTTNVHNNASMSIIRLL